MDLVDLINSRAFLGNEFLMWLWFKADCFDGLLEVEDHGQVEVIFDDALRLEAYMAETERNDFKGGVPAHSPEAKTALRHGKRVAKAKLRIIKEGREWLLTIKAESLEFTGVKIPALLSREEDEQFYERMLLLEELEQIVEAIYEEFVRIRLTSGWAETYLSAMQAWIATDELATPETYPGLAAAAE